MARPIIRTAENVGVISADTILSHVSLDMSSVPPHGSSSTRVTVVRSAFVCQDMPKLTEGSKQQHPKPRQRVGKRMRIETRTEGSFPPRRIGAGFFIQILIFFPDTVRTKNFKEAVTRSRCPLVSIASTGNSVGHLQGPTQGMQHCRFDTDPSRAALCPAWLLPTPPAVPETHGQFHPQQPFHEESAARSVAPVGRAHSKKHSSTEGGAQRLGLVLI